MECKGGSRVKIIDQDKVDRLATEIGQENMPTLLGIFLNELQTYQNQLAVLEGIDQEQYLQEISHALKSSAASFGAEALCAYSTELDARVKAGTSIHNPNNKQQMITLLTDTQHSYQQLLSE